MKMKKIIFTLILIGASLLGFSQACTSLGTGTTKAKVTKVCYDTVVVSSYLNTVTADTVTVTKLIASGPISASNISGNSSGTNTGDQTITLTGDITGSGAGSFATTIGASKVTNSMIFGGIAYSKLSLTGAVLNADIVSLAWSKITSTPTTLAGYGITDASIGVTVASSGTDADYTAVVNTIKYLPVSTLSTARTITIPSGTNGYVIEIYNNEISYAWNLSGDPVYLADRTTIVTSLQYNYPTLIKYISGKWIITN